MRFKTTAKALLRGLQIVEATIPNRTPLQAATHVKMQVADKKLALCATDLAAMVTFSFPVENAQDGIAVIPARKLLNFIKTLGTEEIIAEYSDTTKSLSLTTGAIELELPGLETDDFPTLTAEQGTCFKMDQASFRRALKMTFFAAGEDENRPILNGCYIHFVEGEGRIVATDSRRLAVTVFHPTQLPASPDQTQFVVPKHIAKMLLDHMEAEAEVTCTVGESRASFAFSTDQENYLLVFCQMQGNYPSYNRFVKPLQQENRIPREALLEALKRASTTIEDKESGVTLQFDSSRLQIRANANCNYLESLDMQFKGDPVTTVFAPRYISEALEQMPDDNAVFELVGPQEPLVLKSQDYLYIAMPRRV